MMITSNDKHLKLLLSNKLPGNAPTQHVNSITTLAYTHFFPVCVLTPK